MAEYGKFIMAERAMQGKGRWKKGSKARERERVKVRKVNVFEKRGNVEGETDIYNCKECQNVKCGWFYGQSSFHSEPEIIQTAKKKERASRE